MNSTQTLFAIPTYRLRNVAETVEAYDANFRRNGHSTKLFVFDDSSISSHQKYFQALAQTRTASELIYVGPQEKEKLISFLNRKLRDKKLESLVRNLFRPGYGGNRNFTLIYTLGHFMVSADDDMRPDALFEPDFFQQNVSRIVDDVISQIHASLELWPTLVEICYFEKDKRELPQIRVKNRKVLPRAAA